MIDDLCGKYAAWGEILCFRAYDKKGKKNYDGNSGCVPLAYAGDRL